DRASSRCGPGWKSANGYGRDFAIVRSEQRDGRSCQEMDVQAGKSKHSRCHEIFASMSCPVCSNPATAPALTGTDFLFETTSRIFTLHSCSCCETLFLDPM